MLAERLRSPGPAGAQGIALASRLLDDPASPLRRGDEPGEIWRAATRAADLLG